MGIFSYFYAAKVAHVIAENAAEGGQDASPDVGLTPSGTGAEPASVALVVKDALVRHRWYQLKPSAVESSSKENAAQRKSDDLADTAGTPSASNTIPVVKLPTPATSSNGLLAKPKTPIAEPSPDSVLAPTPTLTEDVPRLKGKAKPKTERSPRKALHFPLRSFSFSSSSKQRKSALSTAQDRVKQIHASAARTHWRLSKVNWANSTAAADRRARQSALLVRALIVGPTAALPVVSKPQVILRKVKSQLAQPRTANRVIAQLRALPGIDHAARGPIHAVCLEYTENEAHQRHFAQLVLPPATTATVAVASNVVDAEEDSGEVQVRETLDVVSVEFPNVATAPVSALTDMFRDMHLIDLLKAPDLGLGQPGDGEGLLAGAVPTAETVINGIKQITPQLMALSYATGRAIVVDHQGVHPPTDRMSVLTYWWGLELLLPPPSLAYLATTQSTTTTVVNFLSAMALVNNGVREILPFVRYIAQYIDFEFNAIRAQDKGQGVVCAATWIMPAAMVPRPWDFADPSAPCGAPIGSSKPPLPTGDDNDSANIGPGGLFPLPMVFGTEKPTDTVAT